MPNKIISKLTSLKGNKEGEAKSREWFYQFPKGEIKPLRKKGKYWKYIDTIGVEIGCDKLAEAKGDLIFSGAKVWSKIV